MLLGMEFNTIGLWNFDAPSPAPYPLRLCFVGIVTPYWHVKKGGRLPMGARGVQNVCLISKFLFSSSLLIPLGCFFWNARKVKCTIKKNIVSKILHSSRSLACIDSFKHSRPRLLQRGYQFYGLGLQTPVPPFPPFPLFSTPEL